MNTQSDIESNINYKEIPTSLHPNSESIIAENCKLCCVIISVTTGICFIITASIHHCITNNCFHR